MSITDAVVLILCNLFWATIVVFILLLKEDKSIRNIFPPKRNPADDPDNVVAATDENLLEFFHKTNERARVGNAPVPISEVVAKRKPRVASIE